jgi:O-antigen/teichoic acid export membrane protein
MTESVRNRTLAGLKWQGVASLSAHAVVVVNRLVLASLLLPRDFGLVGLVAAIASYMMVFGELGLSAGIVQRKDLREEHLSSGFVLNAVGGVVLTGTCLLLAGPLAAAFGKPPLKPILMLFSPYFLLMGLGLVQVAYMTHHLQFRVTSLVELSAQVAYAAVAIPLALLGAGAWSLVWGMLATAAVRATGIWIASPWRPRTGFSWKAFRELFGYSSGSALSTIIQRASMNADILVLGAVLRSSELGFYTFSMFAVRFAGEVFSSIVGKVLFPAFSRIQDRKDTIVAVYVRAVRYLAIMNVPVAVLLFTASEPFLQGVLGNGWIGAAPLLKILSIYSFATALGGPLWAALVRGLGHSYLLFFMSLVRLLAIVGFVLVGAQWGVVGAAVAIACYGMLFRFVYQAIINRKVSLRMTTYLKAILPACACGAVALAGTRAAGYAAVDSLPPLVQFAVVVPLTCGLYLVALRVLFPADLRDLFRDFLSILGSAKRDPGQIDKQQAPRVGPGPPGRPPRRRDDC